MVWNDGMYDIKIRYDENKRGIILINHERDMAIPYLNIHSRFTSNFLYIFTFWDGVVWYIVWIDGIEKINEFRE